MHLMMGVSLITADAPFFRAVKILSKTAYLMYHNNMCGYTN